MLNVNCDQLKKLHNSALSVRVTGRLRLRADAVTTTNKINRHNRHTNDNIN